MSFTLLTATVGMLDDLCKDATLTYFAAVMLLPLPRNGTGAANLKLPTGG